MTWTFDRRIQLFKGYVLSIGLLTAILILVGSASAQLSLPGEVVDVIDGKTVVVATSNGNVSIELQYIDVPDPGQALEETVKSHLRALIIGKRVDYRTRRLAKGRTIGQLTVNGVDISLQMLRDGAAWHVPWQVSGQDRSEFDVYAATEATAKNEKRGVWSVPGLKPAWEFRAEKEIERREEQNSFFSKSGAGPAPRSKTAANSNLSLGDVGALINRYDPVSRTGLLSTSFMGIEVEKDIDSVERMAIDVTYYYKENDRKVRQGSYVVTIAFLSQKPEFLTNNELMVWDNGKITVIRKPKRTVSNRSEGVQEILMYGMSRSLLERAAGNEAIYVKVGRHAFQMTGGRYLLYNLLQVTQ